jgi:lipoprotein NlpI
MFERIKEMLGLVGTKPMFFRPANNVRRAGNPEYDRREKESPEATRARLHIPSYLDDVKVRARENGCTVEEVLLRDRKTATEAFGKALAAVIPGTDCLEPGEVEQYVLGRELPKPRLAHLDGCALCRSLAAAARPDPEVARVMANALAEADRLTDEDLETAAVRRLVPKPAPAFAMGHVPTGVFAPAARTAASTHPWRPFIRGLGALSFLLLLVLILLKFAPWDALTSSPPPVADVPHDDRPPGGADVLPPPPPDVPTPPLDERLARWRNTARLASQPASQQIVLLMKELPELAKATEAAPNDPSKGVLAGVGIDRIGGWDELPKWAAAKAVDPAFENKLKGMKMAQEGNYPGALQCYENVLRLDDKDADAFVLRGDVFAAQEKWDEARAEYERAIQLNADNAVAYAARGLTFAVKEDWDQAIRDYDHSIGLDPDNFVAYARRGLAHEALGDKDMAAADFKQCASLLKRIHPPKG